MDMMYRCGGYESVRRTRVHHVGVGGWGFVERGYGEFRGRGGGGGVCGRGLQ